MLGKRHDPNCDCNSKYVTGKGEKCNKAYGNKRSRRKEDREWRKDNK